MKGEQLKRYRVSFQGSIWRFADVIASSKHEAEQIAYDNWDNEFIELTNDPEWELEYVRENSDHDDNVPLYARRGCLRRE